MKLETIVTDTNFFNSPIRGVTSIIGRVLGDEDFVNIPQHVLEEAGRRGTAVHNAIEEFSKSGQWLTMKVEDLPYIDQFRLWYDKYKPEYLASELKIISDKLGFKGIIDTIFVIDNKLVLCDYKTSANLSMTKTTLQLNLYLLLLKDSGLLDELGLMIDELRVLQLNKTKFKYIKVDIDEMLAYSILGLYKLKVKHNE